MPSGPGFDNDNNLKLFNSLIYQARHRVSLTSSYFVPDESLLAAVTTAAERGVSVELFVSELGDQPLVALIVARELVLIPLATVYRLAVHGRGAHAFQAAAIGKAATVAEVAALGALVIYRPALPPLAIVAGVLGVAAAARYVLRARHVRRDAAVTTAPPI